MLITPEARPPATSSPSRRDLPGEQDFLTGVPGCGPWGSENGLGRCVCAHFSVEGVPGFHGILRGVCDPEKVTKHKEGERVLHSSGAPQGLSVLVMASSVQSGKAKSGPSHWCPEQAVLASPDLFPSRSHARNCCSWIPFRGTLLSFLPKPAPFYKASGQAQLGQLLASDRGPPGASGAPETTRHLHPDASPASGIQS